MKKLKPGYRIKCKRPIILCLSIKLEHTSNKKNFKKSYIYIYIYILYIYIIYIYLCVSPAYLVKWGNTVTLIHCIVTKLYYNFCVSRIVDWMLEAIKFVQIGWIWWNSYLRKNMFIPKTIFNFTESIDNSVKRLQNVVCTKWCGSIAN